MGTLNSMFNSKYSKVLTIILIIVIVLIVGILGFMAYDVYRKYVIDEEAGTAAGKFENQFANNSNTVENIVSNTEVIDPNINLNSINNGNTNTVNTTNGNKVMYQGYEVIGTIEIPKTNIKYPIIKSEDVGLNSLKVAICNLYGELNKKGGNGVLVGHNYRNGTFFSNNKKLTNGDKIYITDNSGKKVTYTIYKKYETGTGDFNYATRKVDANKMEISLSTCTDDSKKRLIIWARAE